MYRQIINPEISYNSDNFSLILESESNLLKMAFRVHGKRVNTRHFPRTLSILKSALPSVLNTKCFNDKNQSFEEEVVETEIGHLFEHLMLEYLLLIKRSLGEKVILNGKTFWDWHKDPRGLFHILIDLKNTDKQSLDLALAKSIGLMEKILNYKTENKLNSLSASLEE